MSDEKVPEWWNGSKTCPVVLCGDCHVRIVGHHVICGEMEIGMVTDIGHRGCCAGGHGENQMKIARRLVMTQ